MLSLSESRVPSSSPDRVGKKPRPRLRTILLLTYVLVLAIPLGGVSLLRLYDSMLIRGTESELIVQGAALAALYRAAWKGPEAGAGQSPIGDDERLEPAIASLDLARHPVLDPMPPGRPPATPADLRAAKIGQALQPLLSDLQRTSSPG